MKKSIRWNNAIKPKIQFFLNFIETILEKTLGTAYVYITPL